METVQIITSACCLVTACFIQGVVYACTRPKFKIGDKVVTTEDKFHGKIISSDAIHDMEVLHFRGCYQYHVLDAGLGYFSSAEYYGKQLRKMTKDEEIIYETLDNL